EDSVDAGIATTRANQRQCDQPRQTLPGKRIGAFELARRGPRRLLPVSLVERQARCPGANVGKELLHVVRLAVSGSLAQVAFCKAGALRDQAGHQVAYARPAWRCRLCSRETARLC